MSVFNELANCVQLVAESELEYCLRAMSLRERVMMLSAEEECPFDEVLVRKSFFHTIFTGLKQNSIRMELQQLLKEGTASNEKLLKEISLAASNEVERLGKITINELDLVNSSESSVAQKSGIGKAKRKQVISRNK